MVALTGCQSRSGSAVSSPQTFNRIPSYNGRTFSPTEQEVALVTLRGWHATLRHANQLYELDRYDRRMGRSFRNQTRDLFPTVPVDIDRDDPGFYTVAIETVTLPQGNYAYVVYRVGNRYDTDEYADVYEYRDNRWVLLNHYAIAHGLMNSVLMDFSWEAYCEEMGIVSAAAATDAP